VGIRVVHGAGQSGFARLVLELSAPPPASGFAVRAIKSKQAKEQSWARIGDWTPGGAASKASRHFISGERSEIVELADYLAAVCPRLNAMLLNANPPSEAKHTDKEPAKKKQKRRKKGKQEAAASACGLCSTNSLAGLEVDLRPSASPAFSGRGAASGAAPATGETEEESVKRREDQVHDALRSCGVGSPESVSCCLKAAILHGHVDISGWRRVTADQRLKLGLSASRRLGSASPLHLLSVDVLEKVAGALPWGDPDPAVRYSPQWRAMVARTEVGSTNPLQQVLTEGSCEGCGRELIVRVADVLHQSDYAGLDYEDGGQNASVQCEDENCGGVYVTGICTGEPSFDSGKFHNHCSQCPLFGECIRDYRMAHCGNCGNHWFSGMSGFPCDACGGKALKPAGDNPPPAAWDQGIEGVRTVRSYSANVMAHLMALLASVTGGGGGGDSEEETEEEAEVVRRLEGVIPLLAEAFARSEGEGRALFQEFKASTLELFARSDGAGAESSGDSDDEALEVRRPFAAPVGGPAATVLTLCGANAGRGAARGARRRARGQRGRRRRSGSSGGRGGGGSSSGDGRRCRGGDSHGRDCPLDAPDYFVRITTDGISSDERSPDDSTTHG
jgi:hypothetical protein